MTDKPINNTFENHNSVNNTSVSDTSEMDVSVNDILANNTPILECSEISKTYTGGVNVLQNVNFSLQRSSAMALVGASGCGKTTLLHVAGLLDNPTDGDVKILGEQTRHMSDFEKTRFRLQHIGFVYQFHNLLPEFSVLENVLYPMWVAGMSKKHTEKHALNLLGDLGMADFKDAKPFTLSGGQAQRVAIARALANTPKLVLADEPTGNLDAQNSQKVWQLLIDIVRHHGAGLLCATHDSNLAHQTDSIITIENKTNSIAKTIL